MFICFVYNLFHYNTAVGDTKGMKKKDDPVPVLKQGKHESDAHYLGRLHKEVEDELNKVEFSKKQRVILIHIFSIF